MTSMWLFVCCTKASCSSCCEDTLVSSTAGMLCGPLAGVFFVLVGLALCYKGRRKRYPNLKLKGDVSKLSGEYGGQYRNWYV